MLNKKLNKLLWIPRAILLVNFTFFIYYATHIPGEAPDIVAKVIELILLIAFFSITFISAPLSGTIYILVSYFESWTLILGAMWPIASIVLHYSMTLAGLLLLLLPYFDKQKK